VLEVSVKLLIPIIKESDKISTKVYENISAGVNRFICDTYVPGSNQVEVYVNGQYQYLGIDFIEISGNEIQLTEPCSEQDDVLIKVRR